METSRPRDSGYVVPGGHPPAEAIPDPEERLAHEGFVITAPFLSSGRCADLRLQTRDAEARGAGSRELLRHGWARALARDLRSIPDVGKLVSDRLAVQCTYFAKTAGTNWLVALHQDLSIPVARRLDAAHCKAWSEKDGTWYCQPPVSLLERLVAVRVLLDDNVPANGPLRVVPGSHRYGRILPMDIDWHRRRSGEAVCTAGLGSAVVMHPLLLHASSKSVSSTPRRVLHYLFAPTELPSGLRWKYFA